MNTFLLVTLADFRESVRAKWFLMYFLIFGGAVVLLFVLGITESRVMGFTGLSRLLITYIQLCVAILPILILIST
ncbi:MAG: ABC transporter permease, partial [Desulfobulbaceae bacterium]|nr:ABC transporter permease [Desulfobulbaceae bacterium]